LIWVKVSQGNSSRNAVEALDNFLKTIWNCFVVNC